VFLTFAVHEVRDVDDQRALFADIHRVLRPDGRLVVTEFGRDVANAAVYGPAILHFQAAAVWRQRAGEAGFGPAVETAITPFVRRFVWTR
jgi:ubiquinone/menaquinone biosynthesis C-methylase UbiE